MRRALVALAVVLALVAWRYAPPAARGVDAPRAEFSAARARAALGRVLGAGTPHPTGSAANAAVRERLRAELAALGIAPDVEEGFACGLNGRCAKVTNLLARVPGTDPGGQAVLLACHYDSVPAGPGAGDDGVGVAVTLEAARALLAGPRPRSDLWLLIDDGEELGLLGAEAFIRDHPGSSVAAVVNVDARGTTGPALMFEMSTGSSMLVRAAASALRRPATNSIYYSIYQRLPNDTDFTVFKRNGVPGVNFAIIGGPQRYHTRRDDLAHLDAGSLQQLGDDALAMVRAFGAGDVGFRTQQQSVFFDLLTWRLVRWPQGSTPWLASLAVLLIAIAVRVGRRRGAEGGGAGWGVLAVLGVLLAVAGLAWALRAGLHAAAALPYRWMASGWALEVGFWALAVAVAAAVAAGVGRRLRPAATWGALWVGWSCLALAAALLAPAVSYPLVVPALIAGLVGVLTAARRGPAGGAWQTLPPLVAAALLVFPLCWMLYTGMGDAVLPAVAVLVGLVLVAALPAFATAAPRARGVVAVAGGVVAAAATIAAVVLPPFTVDAPRPVTLVLEQDADRGASRWVAGAAGAPLPAWLARAASFDVERPFPWWPDYRAWTAPAAAAAQPAPEVTVERVSRAGGQMRVLARLSSRRGASIAGLYLPARRLFEARVEGVEVPTRAGGWLLVEDATLPAAGAEIELAFIGEEPVELYLYDVRTGLGGEGDALVSARPPSEVPLGRGDRSIVWRRVRL